MTELKRIVTVLLSFLMVLGCFLTFSSCKQNDNHENESYSKTEEETVPVYEPIVLSSNGKSDYLVVRHEAVSDDFIAAYKSLLSYLNTTLNAGMSARDDWVEPGVDVDQLFEIIIGGADRKEFRELIDKTDIDGYSIEVIGKKIVIAAHSDALIFEAIGKFKTMLEKNENGDIVLKTNKAEKKGSVSSFFNHDRPLSDYRIVYKKGSLDNSAKLLASRIKKISKVEIPVVSDDTAKSEFEILVGHTNRGVDELPNNNQKVIAEFECYFVTAGNSLKIYGGSDSDSSTQKAVEKFMEEYVNPKKANVITVPNSLNFSGLGGLEGVSPERYEDVELRILSFNILSEEWNDKIPTENRDVKIMATILGLSPDVAGIQELSTKWYSVLQQGIGKTYAFVGRKNPDGNDNYTGLIYNKDRVKLVENGMVMYSKGNSRRLRLLNWGLFESKTTGKRFIACNTHYDANHTGDHTPIRVLQATEMAQAINDLRAKYNVPVFCCGDYNSVESAEPFLTFTKLTGFKDPKYTAKKIINPTKTYHSIGSVVSSAAAEGIDHIACSPDADVVLYNALIGRFWADASDHCPIYIDVNLK